MSHQDVTNFIPTQFLKNIEHLDLNRCSHCPIEEES